MNLTGEIFGKLTVLERAPDINSNGVRGKSCWKTVCECGREKIAQTALLTGGKITSCGMLSCASPRPRFTRITNSRSQAEAQKLRRPFEDLRHELLDVLAFLYREVEDMDDPFGATLEAVIHNSQPIPKPQCGVYFFIHEDTVVYVGKSIDVLWRIQCHIKGSGDSKWCKDFQGSDSLRVSFIPVPPPLLDEVEMFYIEVFRETLVAGYGTKPLLNSDIDDVSKQRIALSILRASKDYRSKRGLNQPE